MKIILMSLFISIIVLLFGCCSWMIDPHNAKGASAMVSFPVGPNPNNKRSHDHNKPNPEKETVSRIPGAGHITPEGFPTREAQIKMEKEDLDRRLNRHRKEKERRKQKSEHRKNVEKLDKQRDKEVEKLDKERNKQVDKLKKEK